MKPVLLGWVIALSSVLPPDAWAQSLPVVDEVELEPLRANCRALLKALDSLSSPLPAETAGHVQALLKDDTKDPAAAAEKTQRLLDPHCLIGVTINPESRVKAARGPASAELLLERPVYSLVKVHNDAGVTHQLVVSGPQLRTANLAGADRWLEAAVLPQPPLPKTLTGRRVEYVILRLTAREVGKREATLSFDVGQGTQDLGFRAEVPILFAIRPTGK